MNRLKEINEKLRISYATLAELEKSYVGKIKGEVYVKRVHQLDQQRKDLFRKARNIGMGDKICIIKGKRRRENKKTPYISVEIPFTLIFTGVTLEEVPGLVKLHIKRCVSYRVQFYNTGQVY